MEYSDEAVQAARNGYNHLKNQVRQLFDQAEISAADISAAGSPADAAAEVDADHKTRFLTAINDDLNMPRAMAAVQETLKSDLPPAVKLATVLDFDQVLGLSLSTVSAAEPLPAEVEIKLAQRQQARTDKNWALSDQLRDEIQSLGYQVQDAKGEQKVVKL
jgi:cysteinyl-tRNA synthetase